MDQKYMNTALLSLETGEIYYLSELGDSDELPDDYEDSDQYLEIPHNNDLDLGFRLVQDFVEERLPDEADRINGFFRGPGAYARYKDLLDSKGLLKEWFDYENERTQSALKEWCAENGVELSE